MLNRIDKMEGGLVRAESYILVVCVLAMLLLAAYNVFYRNVLVPLQVELREAERAAASAAEASGASSDDPSVSEDNSADSADRSEDSESGDFGGGFGGGSDGAEESGDESGEQDGEFRGGFGAQKDDGDGEKSSDDRAGSDRTADGEEDTEFRGGFGEGKKEHDESEAGSPENGGDDEEGGFEGGFGSDDEAEGGSESGEGEDDGFERGFGASGEGSAEEDGSTDESTAGSDASAKAKPAGPKEGGSSDSWARFGVRIIDAMKLSWVDTFLRHMVLVVGFLGGMIAVRRREHITIDAVGRLLTGRTYHLMAALTNVFATVVCAALAWAGWDLVAVSLKFPEELMPGVQLWAVQTVFPIGFGMIAVHFLLRSAGNAARAYLDEPAERALAEQRPGADEGADPEGDET